jgi:hypothetical protein
MEDRAAEESRLKRAARQTIVDTPVERPRPRAKEDDSLTYFAGRFQPKLKTDESYSLRGSTKRLPETDRIAKENAGPEEQPGKETKLQVDEMRSRKNTQQDSRRVKVNDAAKKVAPRRRHWDDVDAKRTAAGRDLERHVEASQRVKQERTTERVGKIRLSESPSMKHSARAQEEAGAGHRSSGRVRRAITRPDATPVRARSARSPQRFARTLAEGRKRRLLHRRPRRIERGAFPENRRSRIWMGKMRSRSRSARLAIWQRNRNTIPPTQRSLPKRSRRDVRRVCQQSWLREFEQQRPESSHSSGGEWLR